MHTVPWTLTALTDLARKDVRLVIYQDYHYKASQRKSHLKVSDHSPSASVYDLASKYGLSVSH